jgi:hypothetical protein
MSSSQQGSLSLEAVRRIDQLCDRFEAALQDRESPRIEDFLSQVDELHRPALLSALLGVELEYRRAWGEQPETREYLARFCDASTAVLTAFEEDARPLSDASEVCLLQVALANASGRRTDRVRIYSRGSLVHTATLSGPLELGRQRQGEDPPFALTPGQFEPRLVIAPLDETTISRRHIRLIPEEDNLVRVVNLSRVNPILFSDGRRLEAEQNDVFSLMLEMTLGPMFLRIDRPGEYDEAAEAPLSEESSDRVPIQAPNPPRFLGRLWSWRRTTES